MRHASSLPLTWGCGGGVEEGEGGVGVRVEEGVAGAGEERGRGASCCQGAPLL
jgi:hypothetical protein